MSVQVIVYRDRTICSECGEIERPEDSMRLSALTHLVGRHGIEANLDLSLRPYELAPEPLYDVTLRLTRAELECSWTSDLSDERRVAIANKYEVARDARLAEIEAQP